MSYLSITIFAIWIYPFALYSAWITWNYYDLNRSPEICQERMPKGDSACTGAVCDIINVVMTLNICEVILCQAGYGLVIKLTNE